MSSVLIVNEISTEREEIARTRSRGVHRGPGARRLARQPRGSGADPSSVAIIPTLLTGTTSTSLQQQLVQMAPEIETLIHGKNDELPALVRKVIQIRDGEAAA